jgi:hypothetical protein
VRSSGSAWRGCASTHRLRTPTSSPSSRRVIAPLIAFLLALTGAVALVAGVTLGLWPVWTLGLLAVAGSVLAYRP